MSIQTLRQDVLNAALEMSRAALTRGTSGNISARDPETGLVAITPTSLPYETLTSEDIIVVDVNGKVVEGKHKPSSETPMHTAVYRARPDVFGVVHTHSPYATALSVANVELPIITIPLVALGPVKIVPFELPGSEELAKQAVAYLGTDKHAIILQNHGVLCSGPTVAKALSNAVYVEEGAQVALFSILAGGLNPIPEAAIQKMHERRKQGKAL